MSTLIVDRTSTGLVPLGRDRALRTTATDPFDLDLRVEVPVVDQSLWSMTNDGCGKTCQSACSPSCTNNG
ncbi:FxLD family lanthipeptide [Nocardiopsis algeriensis]|uniref:FxLD family lantipeptide n=1 Tax=Nocardiopsis algeriensis TaxID=1478215 RepID=A0A841ILH2_9ACTN|nr:FxLD family lanthipeptide [Nocardiopsis algeriensis]MBB6119000.1 FxLD family lantipeptide [Nocardiopsis algeriensis]